MFSTPVRLKNEVDVNNEPSLDSFDYQFLYGSGADNIISRNDAEDVRPSLNNFPMKRFINSSNPATPSTVLDSPSINQSPSSIVASNNLSPPSGKSVILHKRLLPSNSIGTHWTVEMTCLKHSTSYFEAVECLRRVRVMLAQVDKSDRVKFCKSDYDSAIKSLRRMRSVWCDDLFREAVAITNDYFNESAFANLPRDVLMEIFLWMPINKFTPIVSVCWEWCETGTSDEIWGLFYRRKFLMNNPGAMPSLAREDFMTSFHIRLQDPQIGDKVEVAWKGKFRLETQDVYQGLAWWVAEVVDKHHSQGRYKIRYPGWDSRWDEWVPRTRLRWAVSTNTLVSIHANDIVELWCCGANVPGAWLESKVKKVRGDRYCLGKVLSSGYLWVERDRLRLVRSAAEQQSKEADNADSSRGRMGPSFLSSIMAMSMADRFQGHVDEDNHDRRASSCSLM